MESVKRKAVSFWLTHIFLRRVAKRYPDYFSQWIKDTTDDTTARKIMIMRYLGDTQMNFAADVLKDIAKADSALSKACYYDSKYDYSDDKTY